VSNSTVIVGDGDSNVRLGVENKDSVDGLQSAGKNEGLAP
jgi:hypothetical protein